MTKLIAEIGWNHMGDMNLAKEMIAAANESGANSAKFQTWSVQRLKHGSWDDDGRLEIYKKAELSLDQHFELKEYCDKVGIEFLSSVFSIPDAKLLSEVITHTVKIPSAESRNIQLLRYAYHTFDHVYLSTGTSTIDEIAEVTRGHEHKTTYLHCVSAYPCLSKQSNLNRIKHLKDRFGDNVGFSDHCRVIDPSVLALNYGVKVIEKHFTIDQNLPGRDNENAILPKDMENLRGWIDVNDMCHEIDTPDYQDCEEDVRENYSGRFDG